MRLLRRRDGARPRLRFLPDRSWRAGDVQRFVLPYPRNWIFVVVSGAFLAAFTAPLFLTLSKFTIGEGDLFSLVTALFLGAWVLGWSVGVAFLAAIFLMGVLGREELRFRPGGLLVRIGIPVAAIGIEFDAGRIENPRVLEPGPKETDSWRGRHVAFDYSGNTCGVGCNLDAAIAGDLRNRITDLQRTGVAPEPAPDPVPPDPEPADRPVAPPVDYGSPSTLLLIAANVVPLAGVLLAGWSLGEVMILFWVESGIIGLYNLLKIGVVGRWAVLFLGPFFIGHFGAFMAVHFLFIYMIFVRGMEASSGSVPVSEVAGLLLGLWPAILALVASHGYSFIVNFLGRREYEGRRINEQMAEPYRRIVVMHVTIIIGAFLAVLLKSTLPALLLLIALKTGADVRAHVWERKPRTVKAQGAGA